MSDTKNYGLKGVGDDVQFGKAGGRFVFNTGAADFRATTDGTTLAHLQVLTPVADTDAATKLYVDDTAAGLDFKESCVCATTATTGTYNNTGGAAGNGQLTLVSATIDGITLAQGDRVLIKNHTTAAANGIYVVLATTTTLDRATDSDSDTEVTAGNFTFIEEGTINADAGFVLQGPDPLTVGGAGGSAMNWVLFSTSSSIIAGTGLAKIGNVLDLDFSELTSAAVIATADELIFQDGAVESRITVANFLADRDIVTATANGMLARTANDTYASRTITASSTATEEGLIVANGNGVSGNPTIGLDIQGTTSASKNATNTDELIIFDGTNNLAYSISELANAPAFDSSGTQIGVGDTSVIITDTGTDGTITTVADNATVIVTTVSGSTFTVDSATTNANIPVIRLSATSTGTPLAGIGPSIEFQSETAAGAPGNQEIGGLLALEATDVTALSEDFDFVFQLMAGGIAATEVARIASTGSITSSALTDNRVLLAGTSGIIEDDANFTFNGTILALTAAMDITGDLDVDNVNINGNTISATNLNGSLVILPSGTGSIIFQNGSGEEVLELNDTVAAINGLAITAGATGNKPIISIGTGGEANVDIGFATNGTGVLSVAAGTYEDNVTDDDDIPNKKYVDDQIALTGGSGTVDTITGVVDIAILGVQNIGSATGIPANCTILSVTMEVTDISDTNSTVTVGDITNGAASYMAAAENDPEILGTYVADTYVANGAGARQATATVANDSVLSASATIIITFRHV